MIVITRNDASSVDISSITAGRPDIVISQYEKKYSSLSSGTIRGGGY